MVDLRLIVIAGDAEVYCVQCFQQVCKASAKHIARPPLDWRGKLRTKPSYWDKVNALLLQC